MLVEKMTSDAKRYIDIRVLSLRDFMRENQFDPASFQRSADPDHIDDIYEGLKKRARAGQPVRTYGAIIACLVRDTGNKYIVDGQHRISSMLRIQKEYIDTDCYLAVDWHSIKTEDEALELFQIHNKAKPAPQTPTGISLKNGKELMRYMILEYAVTPEGRAGKLFQRRKCRPYIFETDFLEEFGRFEMAYKRENKKDLNIEEAKKEIDKVCYAYEQTSDEAIYALDGKLKKQDVKTRSWSQFANYHRFYPALRRNLNWIWELYVDHSSNGGAAMAVPRGQIGGSKAIDMPRGRPDDRKKIDVAIKNVVFAKFFNKCQYCKVAVSDGSKHIAHIHPHALGGDDAISNYTLLCDACNKSIGMRNLVDYIRETGVCMTAELADHIAKK